MDLSTYESGAVAAKPGAPTSPSSGYPTDGDPSSGTPATTPGAYWFYQMAEELNNLLTQAGVAPDHTKLTQLFDMLEARYAAKGIASRKQIFTSNGTFIVPANITTIWVSGAGGGAGGGGGTSTTFGEGGGAGGQALRVPMTVTPGQSVSITIGAYGAGGAPGVDGSDGGTTIIQGLGQLYGGIGGSHTGGSAGGGGTTTISSLFAFTGQGGTDALSTGPAGVGGASLFGLSGPSRSAQGPNSTGFGAGGPGGTGNNGSSGAPGGNGAPGIVIIEW